MKNYLLRKANATSRRMHEEVNLHVIGGDNNRSKIQQANLAFVIAKRIIASLPVAPANDFIYSIVDDIQLGLYDDLGPLDQCDNNWDDWVNRTVYIMKSNGKLMDYDNTTHKPMLEMKF